MMAPESSSVCPPFHSRQLHVWIGSTIGHIVDDVSQGMTRNHVYHEVQYLPRGEFLMWKLWAEIELWWLDVQLDGPGSLVSWLLGAAVVLLLVTILAIKVAF